MSAQVALAQEQHRNLSRTAKYGSEAGYSTRVDTLALYSFVRPLLRVSVVQQRSQPSNRRRLRQEPRCTIRGSASCDGTPNSRRRHGRHPSGYRTKPPNSADPPVPAGRPQMAWIPMDWGSPWPLEKVHALPAQMVWAVTVLHWFRVVVTPTDRMRWGLGRLSARVPNMS